MCTYVVIENSSLCETWHNVLSSLTRQPMSVECLCIHTFPVIKNNTFCETHMRRSSFRSTIFCFKYTLSKVWKPNNRICQAPLKLTPPYLEVLSSYLAHRWDCYGFPEFLQAKAWILSQTTPWLCPLILFPNSLFTSCSVSDVIQSGLLKALLNKPTRTSKFHHLIELLQCLDLQCCHEK